MTMHQESRQEQHAHATVGTYLRIAAILTIVTIIELTIPYVPKSFLPTGLGIMLLAVLSLAKFALVCMFFMHLFYDSRLMTFLFCIGFMLMAGLILSTKALMNAHSLEKPSEIVVKKKPLTSPDATRGKGVFATHSCVTCHIIKEIENARGTTGPPLDGIADRAATREPGKDAKAYVEESIVSPQAYVVQGYPPTMPSDIRNTLDDQDFVDLVAYLLTLHEKK